MKGFMFGASEQTPATGELLPLWPATTERNGLVLSAPQTYSKTAQAAEASSSLDIQENRLPAHASAMLTFWGTPLPPSANSPNLQHKNATSIDSLNFNMSPPGMPPTPNLLRQQRAYSLHVQYFTCVSDPSPADVICKMTADPGYISAIFLHMDSNDHQAAVNLGKNRLRANLQLLPKDLDDVFLEGYSLACTCLSVRLQASGCRAHAGDPKCTCKATEAQLQHTDRY